MSAANLLMMGARSAGAVLCPHPGRLQSCAIQVDGGRGPMLLCPECKDALSGLIAGWHARTLGPSEVVGRMRKLGYGRLDAAHFLLQLVGDRLKVRIGLLKEAQL